MSLYWWSIEVRNAGLWREAHGDALVEAAVAHGAKQWDWILLPWGLVFEIAFAESDDWLRYRDLPGVRAALDAVPDAFYIYPGRGGSAGAGQPRRPRPPAGAGAAPLPEEPPPVIVAGNHPAAEFQPPTLAEAS